MWEAWAQLHDLFSFVGPRPLLGYRVGHACTGCILSFFFGGGGECGGGGFTRAGDGLSTLQEKVGSIRSLGCCYATLRRLSEYAYSL